MQKNCSSILIPGKRFSIFSLPCPIASHISFYRINLGRKKSMIVYLIFLHRFFIFIFAFLNQCLYLLSSSLFCPFSPFLSSFSLYSFLVNFSFSTNQVSSKQASLKDTAWPSDTCDLPSLFLALPLQSFPGHNCSSVHSGTSTQISQSSAWISKVCASLILCLLPETVVIGQPALVVIVSAGVRAQRVAYHMGSVWSRCTGAPQTFFPQH